MRYCGSGVLGTEIERLDLSGNPLLNLRHGGYQKQRPEQRHRGCRVPGGDHCPYLIGKTAIRDWRAGLVVKGQKVQ